MGGRREIPAFGFPNRGHVVELKGAITQVGSLMWKGWPEFQWYR